MLQDLNTCNIMLKRKVNLSEGGDDVDSCCLSSQAEISSRKIFRARRPVRTASTEVKKFKITTNLVSLEEEIKLLSLENKQKGSHLRTKSQNLFDYSNFSAYSLIEPFKEIIEGRELGSETQNLKGFLESSKENREKICRFEAECRVKGNENEACCQIFMENDEFWMSVSEKGGSRVFEGKVLKDSVCRDGGVGSESSLMIQLDRKGEWVGVSFGQIAKHMFLRSFAEAKSRSFFN